MLVTAEGHYVHPPEVYSFMGGPREKKSDDLHKEDANGPVLLEWSVYVTVHKIFT